MRTADQAARDKVFARLGIPEPPFPPDHLDAGGRRRPWPVILAAWILALVLIVAGIGSWWLSSQFEPIRANSGAPSIVRVEGGLLTRVDANEPTTGQPLVAFHAPYRDGRWLEMGFTLVNDAPFSVAVDEIGSPSFPGDPLRRIAILMEVGENSDQMAQFRPFVIPPQERLFILVRYRFAGCSLSGSRENYATYTSQRVKFGMRVGWITIHRSQALPLGYSVAVSGNEGCGK